MSTSVIDGNVMGLYALSLSLNPVSVAANTTAEQTFTIPGIRGSGDLLLQLSTLAPTAGVGIVGFRVLSANTIGVTFSNLTAGAIDPPLANYVAMLARLDSDLLKAAP